MTIVTPKFGMGASVLRVEDQTFITGQGRYTDDIAPDGLLHGFVLRSPVAKGGFTIGSTEAAKAGAGRASGADRRRSCASRRPALRRHAEAARRHPRADPRHPDPVPRPRPPCRRRRRLHRRRHARAGAGRRRADRGRLRFRRCRGRHRDRARRRHAAGLARARHATAPSSTSSATRRRPTPPSPRPPGGRHQVHQQPAGLQLHGAALGDRRVEAGRGPLRADHRLAGRARHARHASPARCSRSRRRSCASSPPMSAAASARRPSSTANIRWCSRRPSGSAGRSNGPATAPSISSSTRRAATITSRPRWRSTATAASSALRVDLIANIGAYISQYGPFIPYIGVTMSTGVYDIPALDVTIHGVYTNTCPVDAYRGAGRPEAACLLEKLVDECARADSAWRATRSAAATSSSRSSFPTAPRPAGSTTSASSTAT